MVNSVSKHQQEKSLKLGINRKTNNVNNNYDSYKKFKHRIDVLFASPGSDLESFLPFLRSVLQILCFFKQKATMRLEIIFFIADEQFFFLKFFFYFWT